MIYRYLVIIGVAVSLIFVFIADFRVGKCVGDKGHKKPFWIILTITGFAFLMVFSFLGWQISDIMNQS